MSCMLQHHPEGIGSKLLTSLQNPLLLCLSACDAVGISVAANAAAAAAASGAERISMNSSAEMLTTNH